MRKCTIDRIPSNGAISWNRHHVETVVVVSRIRNRSIHREIRSVSDRRHDTVDVGERADDVGSVGERHRERSAHVSLIRAGCVDQAQGSCCTGRVSNLHRNQVTW